MKTVSLWSYINSFKSEFKNSAYVEHDGVVECSTAMSSLQLWTAYYFQYKEVIDDSLNEVTVNASVGNMATAACNNNMKGQEAIAYTMTPPLQSVCLCFFFFIALEIAFDCNLQ